MKRVRKPISERQTEGEKQKKQAAAKLEEAYKELNETSPVPRPQAPVDRDIEADRVGDFAPENDEAKAELEAKAEAKADVKAAEAGKDNPKKEEDQKAIEKEKDDLKEEEAEKQKEAEDREARTEREDRGAERSERKSETARE